MNFDIFWIWFLLIFNFWCLALAPGNIFGSDSRCLSSFIFIPWPARHLHRFQSLHFLFFFSLNLLLNNNTIPLRLPQIDNQLTPQQLEIKYSNPTLFHKVFVHQLCNLMSIFLRFNLIVYRLCIFGLGNVGDSEDLDELGMVQRTIVAAH